MNEAMEELHKRLEAATCSSASGSGASGGGDPNQPGTGHPDHLPEAMAPELAEWQRVWRAFGQLLDAAEQSLPEPVWKLPPEKSVAPVYRPFWHPSRLVRDIWGGGWVWQAAMAATVAMVLVGGGLAVWWLGQLPPEGANQPGLAATTAQSPSQAATDFLPTQTESFPGPTKNPPASNQSGSLEKLAVAKAPVPVKAPASQTPANQDETLCWDDQWEQTILSLQQICREVEGNGLFQDDPFPGIRQKIQQIQTELDQAIL